MNKLLALFCASFAGTYFVVAAPVKPVNLPRVILIPLDDRPACLHFPQMIANMACAKVKTPPKRMLGNAFKPGNSDAILCWLSKQRLTQSDAVVVSLDMILYGGLVASRQNDLAHEVISSRLKRLIAIKKANSNVPFYAFSSIMRLAPTVTPENRKYYDDIKEYFVLEDQMAIKHTPQVEHDFQRVKAALNGQFIEGIKKNRSRNHAMQKLILYSMKDRVFDYLVFGQDDANVYGPHRSEVRELQALAKESHLNADRVFFAQGTDQFGSVLASRAVLKKLGITPKVKLVFSDPAATNYVAKYESQSIYQSTVDQVITSGAEIATDDSACDYKHYVNIPNSKTQCFEKWKLELEQDVDKNVPTALADTDLDYSSKNTQFGNIALLKSLCDSKRIVKLLSYASWNTASNTTGTSIPAANLFWVGKQLASSSKRRLSVLNHHKFILHRVVDDYGYHAITREQAKDKVAQLNATSFKQCLISEWALTGDSCKILGTEVAERTKTQLQKFFDDLFLNVPYGSNEKSYQIRGISNIKVELPWKRLFEQYVNFDLVGLRVK
jgi:hypothetical protein